MTEKPTPTEFEPSAQAMRELVKVVADRVVDWLDSLPHRPACVLEGTASALAGLDEPLPETGIAIDELLDLVFSRVLACGYNTASPGTLSFVTGGGLFHAALADFIATATNPFVTYWAASPGGAQIEHTVVRWFCDVVGLPPGAGGVLTSGGSMAMLTAFTTARRDRLGTEPRPAAIYFSDQAHHAVQKAALAAGFAPQWLREIESDDRGCIRVDRLLSAIVDDRAAGLTPLVVVGMAGTTGTGAVDDLVALAELARREDLWFHVDGAYGGLFALTERGRQVLTGIDRADSVIVDPHKTLFLPFGTGCLLVRNVEALRAAHRLHSHCVRESVAIGEACRTIDPADLSVELTRDFRGLRVWLPLKLFGAATFRAYLDEKLDLARDAERALRLIDGIEITGAPVLSTVAFRYAPRGRDPSTLDALNQRILARINAAGRVHLSSAQVRGAFALRICVLAFRAHADAVARCLEELQAAIAVEHEAIP